MGKSAVKVVAKKKDERLSGAPDYIRLFDIALSDVKKSLKVAADIFIEAVDHHKEARSEFYKYFPNMFDYFRNIEMLGRGQLREDVLHISGHVGDMMRRLPVSTQNELMENGVKMLTANGDTLVVKGDAITALQARQIISPDGSIRTLPQQRAWVESQKMRAEQYSNQAAKKVQVKVVHTPKWEIKNGKLIVYGYTEFDKHELFDIMSKMI